MKELEKLNAMNIIIDKSTVILFNPMPAKHPIAVISGIRVPFVWMNTMGDNL